MFLKVIIFGMYGFGLSVWAKPVQIELPNVSSLTINALEFNQAKANIVAFIGGKGLRNSTGKSRNFLVRAKDTFGSQGMNYYLYPSPNKQTKASYAYRSSSDNIRRISNLIQAIKKRNKLPIYLLGFSRGTVDVVSYMNRFGQSVDGVILASGIYENQSKKAKNYAVESILNAQKLNNLLLVHHENDQCVVSVPSKAIHFFENLSVSKKELVLVKGDQSQGRACGPFHYHGFEGIEAEVANKITDWIKKQDQNGYVIN